MGKLRNSLIGATRLLDGIDKSVKGAADSFGELASNAYSLCETGRGGIDELFLYVDQKLKTEGKEWKDSKDQQLREVADRNVAVFIKGINDFQKQAITYSSRWDTLGKGLEGDLQKAQQTLNDINGQLSKKKKKLLKSKKYKDKLRIYSKTLDELQTKLDSIAAELKTLRSDLQTTPPSVANLKKNLNMGLDTTLADLKDFAGMGTKGLLKEYSKAKSSTEKSTRKLRQAGDFRGELKILKEMAEEAEEMESEAEEKG